MEKSRFISWFVVVWVEVETLGHGCACFKWWGWTERHGRTAWGSTAGQVASDKARGGTQGEVIGGKGMGKMHSGLSGYQVLESSRAESSRVRRRGDGTWNDVRVIVTDGTNFQGGN